ncbi:MAG: alpha/beta fold hydrolase [Alphaproteobacteria bacterium]|nr:alpha/beta fold hydrolase [Alphaproteobacteria bacterium]
MTSPWFDRQPQDETANAVYRLFCFPYAGAGASLFRPWSRWLPGGIEVVAIQLPGREARIDEPPLCSMDDVITSLMEDLPPLLDRPFALFGHSTGATISFELARVLRQRGLPQPDLLMISSQDGPRHKPACQRHDLPDTEFIEILRACKGTPDALLRDSVLLEMLLPCIRADGAVYETYEYRPQPPLNSRIAVFHGREDDMVSAEGLASWRVETAHSFHCHDGFSGGHFFLHEDEEAFSTQVNKELEMFLP